MAEVGLRRCLHQTRGWQRAQHLSQASAGSQSQLWGCDRVEQLWELPSTKPHTHARLQARSASAEPSVLPFRLYANLIKHVTPHLGCLAPDVKPLGWGAM